MDAESAEEMTADKSEADAVDSETGQSNNLSEIAKCQLWWSETFEFGHGYGSDELFSILARLILT